MRVTYVTAGPRSSCVLQTSLSGSGIGAKGRGKEKTLFSPHKGGTVPAKSLPRALLQAPAFRGLPPPGDAQDTDPSPATACGCQFSCSHKCLPCSGELPSFIIFLIPAFIMFFNPSVHTTHFEHRAVAVAAARRVKRGICCAVFPPPCMPRGHLCVRARAVRGVGASSLTSSHSENSHVCFTHACLTARLL